MMYFKQTVQPLLSLILLPLKSFGKKDKRTFIGKKLPLWVTLVPLADLGYRPDLGRSYCFKF